MNELTQIFKMATRAFDLVKGTVCIKGMYADETSKLTVSSLIPYFARDIFMAQKDEPLLKARIEFKVIAGIFRPSIEVSLPEGILEEDFKKIQAHLTQILWRYNFISYDAKTDCYKQRFSYVFVFSSLSHSINEAA